MKLFTDTYHTYVASSLEHLEMLTAQLFRPSYEAVTGFSVKESWEAIDPDKEVAIYWGKCATFKGAHSIRLGDKAPDADHLFLVKAKASDWARSQKPGLLSGAEF